MIEPMHRIEKEAMEEVLSKESPEPVSSLDPPTAYIPACGTLCDAFWWARRSGDRKKSSD